MTEGLIDDEKGSFRAGGGVDQIFNLKQIAQKAQEKKHFCVHEFYEFEEGI